MTSKDIRGFLLTLIFSGERTIAACANAAYRDVQRALSGIGNMRDNDQDAYHKYRADIERFLVNSLESLPKPEKFDAWHRDTCMEIREKSDKHGIHKYVTWLKAEKEEPLFTYGLAQKWLNMTIKNMIVMENEEWNKHFESLKKVLHVPVDDNIMEAASDIGITIPRKKGEPGEYPNYDSKPWSRWNEADYSGFQGKLRCVVGEKYQLTPMEWEFPAWCEIAAKRESKNGNRYIEQDSNS